MTTYLAKPKAPKMKMGISRMAQRVAARFELGRVGAMTASRPESMSLVRLFAVPCPCLRTCSEWPLCVALSRMCSQEDSEAGQNKKGNKKKKGKKYVRWGWDRIV